MAASPYVQHYRNPFKWGWYYVEGPNTAMTGLMSKRAAKRMMRDSAGSNNFGYGYRINYPHGAPANKLLRRIGFPLKNLSIA